MHGNSARAAAGGSAILGYGEFQARLAREEISPVYLFCGEEQFLAREGLNLLQKFVLSGNVEGLDYDLLEGKEARPQEIVERAETFSFQGGRRLVVAWEPDFLTAGSAEREGQEEAALLAYLQAPNPSTCLALIAGGKVDRRRKLYRAVAAAGAVVELNALKGEQLTRWLKGRAEGLGKRLEPSAAAYLEVVLGNNLFLLEQELKKAAAWVGQENLIQRPVLEELLGYTAEAGVFELVDAVAEKKAALALRLIRRYLRAGEQPIRLVALLARQFRLLLEALALSTGGEEKLAETLGVHPFVARNLARQCRRFTACELERGMQTLLELDRDLKTSLGEPRSNMELAVLRLCGVVAQK